MTVIPNPVPLLKGVPYWWTPPEWLTHESFLRGKREIARCKFIRLQIVGVNDLSTCHSSLSAGNWCKNISPFECLYRCVCRCKFPMTAKNAVPSPKKQLHEWKRPFGFPFSFHVVIANKTAGIAAVVSKWKNSSNSSGHEGLKYWEKFLPHFYFHYCTSHKILAYRLSFVKLCHEIVNISTCFHCVFTE